MAKPLFGLLADFADADALLAATRAAHQAGYRHMEAFSPFPLEAIEPLLGLDHREPIRWGVAGALFGALAGFALQIYVNLDYPLDIGGRPLVALQAFAVVGFLLMILFAGLFAVFGLLLACRLPLLHHPLFEAESSAAPRTTASCCASMPRTRCSTPARRCSGCRSGRSR